MSVRLGARVGERVSPNGSGSDGPERLHPGPRRLRRWHGRRRAGVLLVVAVSLAAVAVAAVAQLRSRGTGASGDAAAPVAAARATVTRQDLVARQDVDGTLGYAGAAQVVNQRAGTLTAVPAEGATVERGASLYSVDNRPVPLLYGDLPAWRRLAAGVADGPDVRQLEANLVALGYATEQDLKVDDTFTAATASAVHRWQQALGAGQTGAVEPGDAVFLPGAVRVKSVKEARGASLRQGAPIAEVTGTTRVVRVDLEAAKQALVKVGDEVEVRLPDGKTVGGTVTAVATVARAKGGSGGDGSGQGSKPVVAVDVGLDDPATAGSLDEAPVRVGIVTGSRTAVLTVPVNALLALREGGYGVRVVDGAVPRVVAVETGLFAKGLVEVRGQDVREGMAVEVPAS